MTAIKHFIGESFNKKDNIAAIFFDFSSAFDSINHELFINKLEKMGVRGISEKWITSYLRNRE